MVRFKQHQRNADVPGLGGLGGLEGLKGLALGEIDRTDVVLSSNERSRCTDKGYVKRFDVP